MQNIFVIVHGNITISVDYTHTHMALIKYAFCLYFFNFYCRLSYDAVILYVLEHWLITVAAELRHIYDVLRKYFQHVKILL